MPPAAGWLRSVSRWWPWCLRQASVRRTGRVATILSPVMVIPEAPRPDEVVAVARGIAAAVAPAGGLTDVQVAVLHAITRALTEVDVDYRSLEPLSAQDLADVLAPHGPEYRQRIIHHMVLGELVLRPIP